MSFNKLEDFTGRYGINIGQSIINAWNERNNIPTQRTKNDTRPEFHLIRYSSKPDSIDHELTPTEYKLERPGTKGALHRSSPLEQPSKDWECVLLWDPETRTFTLEKVDSTLTVTLERPTSVPNSAPGSRSNVYNRHGEGKAKRIGKGKGTAPHRVATPVPNKPQDQELEEGEIDEFADHLMKELDVEGEKENVDLKGLSVGSSSRRQEEVNVVKQRRPPVHPPVQPPKPKTTANASPKIAEAPKLPTKPKPKAKPNTSAAAVATINGQKEKGGEILIQLQEGPVAIEDLEEEELMFGQPYRPLVRRNPHSEPHPFANLGLALPGSPSPTPIYHAQPRASQVLQPQLTSQYDVVEEDDVVEDVDEDLFANEIEMLLEDNDEEGEDEDEELESVHVPIESDIPTTTGRPLSLTALAGGNNDTDTSDSDDDTSSESSE